MTRVRAGNSPVRPGPSPVEPQDLFGDPPPPGSPSFMDFGPREPSGAPPVQVNIVPPLNLPGGAAKDATKDAGATDAAGGQPFGGTLNTSLQRRTVDCVEEFHRGFERMKEDMSSLGAQNAVIEHNLGLVDSKIDVILAAMEKSLQLPPRMVTPRISKTPRPTSEMGLQTTPRTTPRIRSSSKERANSGDASSLQAVQEVESFVEEKTGEPKPVQNEPFRRRRTPRAEHEEDEDMLFGGAARLARSGTAAAMNPEPQSSEKTRQKYRDLASEVVQQVNEQEWSSSVADKLHSKNNRKKKPMNIVEKVGSSVAFQIFSTLIVIANVIIVSVQTNQQIGEFLDISLCVEGRGPAPTPGNSDIWNSVELVMLAWMVAELIINVYIDRGFTGKSSGWNIFDAVIIGGTILQLIFAGINLSILRVIRLGRAMKFVRILRLIKVLKVLNVSRLLNGARQLVLCVVGSASSIFWAVGLLFFFLFLVSLFLMQGMEVFYAARVDELGSLGSCSPGGFSPLWNGQPAPSEMLPRFQVDPEADTHTEQVKKLYGSVGRTMMTFFSTISGGSEWQVVADPLARISEFFFLVWVVFICITFYGVLNVFTGVFCEAAMEAAKRDTTTILQQEHDEFISAEKTLRHAFEKVDVDGSGNLTEEELNEVLADEDVSVMLTLIGLQTSESKGLFKLLDEDRSGCLSIDEFIDGCMSLKGSARRLDMVTLMMQNKRLTKTVGSLMEMCDAMWVDMESLSKASRAAPAPLAIRATGGESAPLLSPHTHNVVQA